MTLGETKWDDETALTEERGESTDKHMTRAPQKGEKKKT